MKFPMPPPKKVGAVGQSRRPATIYTPHRAKISQPCYVLSTILPKQNRSLAAITLADRIEARFAEGQKRVDSITQAILAKAFRGELVPTEFELAKSKGRSDR